MFVVWQRSRQSTMAVGYTKLARSARRKRTQTSDCVGQIYPGRIDRHFQGGTPMRFYSLSKRVRYIGT